MSGSENKDLPRTAMRKITIAVDIDGTLRCNCSETCRDTNDDVVELCRLLKKMKNTRAEQAVNKRHHSPLGIGVRPAYKGFMVRRFGKYVGYYRTLDEAVKASELAGRREK